MDRRELPQNESDDIARPEIEVAGSYLALVPGGRERLDALLALVGRARHRLRLFYYIFADDEAGMAVREALIDACNRGVAVTLIVDAFGSAETPSAFFQPLIEAGARFGLFGARRSTRYLIRNHQKMAIADGDRAMIGGFNCSRDYFIYPSDASGWSDLGLLVEGPLARDLERWYDHMAAWALGTRQTFRQLRALVRRWVPSEASAIWLMGGPTRRLNAWAKRIKKDMEAVAVAGGRADIAAAYFSPGSGMLRRLTDIACDGHTRLILAGKSDNSATIGAARHLFARMLRAGVEIREFMPCKLHMKLYVLDDIVYVGSANFDKRSLFLNLEVMLRVRDVRFAAECRALLDGMAEESRLIDRRAYRRMRGPLRSIAWWFAYQIVGVLDYTVTRRLNFRRETRH